MRCAGDITTMEDVKFPKQLFYGEMKHGKHPRQMKKMLEGFRQKQSEGAQYKQWSNETDDGISIPMEGSNLLDIWSTENWTFS